MHFGNGNFTKWENSKEVKKRGLPINIPCLKFQFCLEKMCPKKSGYSVIYIN